MSERETYTLRERHEEKHDCLHAFFLGDRTCAYECVRVVFNMQMHRVCTCVCMCACLYVKLPRVSSDRGHMLSKGQDTTETVTPLCPLCLCCENERDTSKPSHFCFHLSNNRSLDFRLQSGLLLTPSPFSDLPQSRETRERCQLMNCWKC